MEYVCGALEDEARDVVGDAKGIASEEGLKLALSRRGSSDEVALLVAGALRHDFFMFGGGGGCVGEGGGVGGEKIDETG
jgi:hypothetical protein